MCECTEKCHCCDPYGMHEPLGGKKGFMARAAKQKALPKQPPNNGDNSDNGDDTPASQRPTRDKGDRL